MKARQRHRRKLTPARTTPTLRGWRRRCDPQETGKLHSRSSPCGTRGFPGLTAKPQHTLGPSWSVRLQAAPHRVGPAVFRGSPPSRNTLLVPPGVCGSRPLLTVWDPRFSGAHRQAATHSWSLLECAAPGHSSPCGTRGFPGLTAKPQHTVGPSWSVRLQAAPHRMGPAVFRGSPASRNTLLVPPGVCGSRPLLTVWDPRFSGAHRQAATHSWSLPECAAPGRSSPYGTRGFPGLTAKPQHTLGPSWSVRLQAAPHRMGPAVFRGSPPSRNTLLVPPGVCGSRPLLTVWDPRFSGAHRQAATHSWPLLECAAPGRSSPYGTRGFPGLTAKPQHTLGPSWSVRLQAAPHRVGPAVFPGSPPSRNTLLVPPGVCGSRPLLTVWDPRFSGAHRQAATHSWSLLECAAPGRSSPYGTRGFPGRTAKPQHTLGPSWSVRLQAAPHRVGPAVSLGSPPSRNTLLVPPGVCGSRPLLTVWDPRFSGAHRQAATHSWSLLECAAPGRSSPHGTRGFPGLTAKPQHTLGPSWSVRLQAAPHRVGPAVFRGSPPSRNTLLVPPGVCGSRPLLTVWDPRFPWAHRQAATHSWSLLECAAPGRSSPYGTRGFPGLTAKPQHTLGPSWSVRLQAAPHRVGPAVFRGSPAKPQHTLGTSWSVRLQAAPHRVGPAVSLGAPPSRNALLVPPGVCGSRPLLTVWDPRFSGAHRQAATHSWSLLECAAPGRSSPCGTRGFPGLTAKPQHTLGPSWSVPLQAAPHRMGPAVSLGSPPSRNTLLVPPGVCGSRPLLTVWDPRFSGAHRQAATHSWSLLECAAPGRSSPYGTRGFPGLTAKPQHTLGPSWSVRLQAAPHRVGPAVFRGSPPSRITLLVPPGVCGSRPLLTVWDPRFSGAHRQAATHSWSLLECAAPGRSSPCGTRGFPGLTAKPQHTLGPSWSVRLQAAPHRMGPAVFRGSPPSRNTLLVPPGVCGSRPLLTVWDPRFSGAHRQAATLLVPPGVCGSRPLLTVWDPRFSGAHRQAATHSWSLLECAAPGRSSPCGTRGFPGLTAKPQHTLGPSWSVRLQAAPHRTGPTVFRGSPPSRNTLLVPPGVCGSRPLLTVWDPRFSGAHRQAATHSWSLLECAAPGRSSPYGTRGFPGLTAKPQHTLGPSWSVRLQAAPHRVGPAVFLGSPPSRKTLLVPPGVCGSRPLLTVWDPRFHWAHRQPIFCPLKLGKRIAAQRKRTVE